MRLILTGIPLMLLLGACVVTTPRATSQSLNTVIPDSARYFDPDREYFVVGQDTVRLQFEQPLSLIHI